MLTSPKLMVPVHTACRIGPPPALDSKVFRHDSLRNPSLGGLSWRAGRAAGILRGHVPLLAKRRSGAPGGHRLRAHRARDPRDRRAHLLVLLWCSLNVRRPARAEGGPERRGDLAPP